MSTTTDRNQTLYISGDLVKTSGAATVAPWDTDPEPIQGDEDDQTEDAPEQEENDQTEQDQETPQEDPTKPQETPEGSKTEENPEGDKNAQEDEKTTPENDQQPNDGEPTGEPGEDREPTDQPGEPCEGGNPIEDEQDAQISEDEQDAQISEEIVTRDADRERTEGNGEKGRGSGTNLSFQSRHVSADELSATLQSMSMSTARARNLQSTPAGWTDITLTPTDAQTGINTIQHAARIAPTQGGTDFGGYQLDARADVYAKFRTPRTTRAYNAAAQKVKDLTNAMKRQIALPPVISGKTEHGYRSGALDGNSLVKLYNGTPDPRLYQRTTKPAAPRYQFGIVLDDSGSMEGTPWDEARALCIALCEALRGHPDIDVIIRVINGYAPPLYVSDAPDHGPEPLGVLDCNGGTDTAGAITRIRAEMEHQETRQTAQGKAQYKGRAVIVLTDGADSPGRIRRLADAMRRTHPTYGVQILEYTNPEYRAHRNGFKDGQLTARGKREYSKVLQCYGPQSAMVCGQVTSITADICRVIKRTING